MNAIQYFKSGQVSSLSIEPVASPPLAQRGVAQKYYYCSIQMLADIRSSQSILAPRASNGARRAFDAAALDQARPPTRWASRRALRARTGRERGARAIRGQGQRRLVAGSDQDPEAEAHIDSRRPSQWSPHSNHIRFNAGAECPARGSRRRALPDSQGASPLDILDGRSRQLVRASAVVQP